MSEIDGIIGKEGKRRKLENPARVAELDPGATLARIGFKEGMTLCDIGAGSGIFSLAAASLSSGDIWAVDTDGEILAELEQRAKIAGMDNIHAISADGCDYNVRTGSADVVLLVTVLHEVDDKKALLREMRRIMKNEGRSCIIEFVKDDTKMGPPKKHRISAAETEALFRGEGFKKKDEFLLGANFYCQTYK